MDDPSRYLRVMFRRDLRRFLWQDARECGVAFRLLRYIDKEFPQEHYVIIVSLLKTKTFKSEFRRSVAAQARAWFNDEQHRLMWKFPLSKMQLYSCKLPHKAMQSLMKKSPRFLAEQRHLKRQESLPIL